MTVACSPRMRRAPAPYRTMPIKVPTWQTLLAATCCLTAYRRLIEQDCVDITRLLAIPMNASTSTRSELYPRTPTNPHRRPAG